MSNTSNRTGRPPNGEDRRTEEEYMSDPTPQNTKYRPSDFVIPAQDHLGHSERMWFRAQPSMDRALDVVVRSRRFPFRTKGDVMRWATHQGLKHLAKLENMPALGSVIRQVDMLKAMMNDELYWHELKDSISLLQKVVDKHISEGAKGEAIRMIAQARKTYMGMTDEPFWQQKYLEELDRRFAHIAKDMPKVGLHTSTSTSTSTSKEGERDADAQ